MLCTNLVLNVETKKSNFLYTTCPELGIQWTISCHIVGWPMQEWGFLKRFACTICTERLKIYIKFWPYNLVDLYSYQKLSKNLELEEDRWCLMSEDPSSEDKPESVPTLQRTTFWCDEVCKKNKERVYIKWGKARNLESSKHILGNLRANWFYFSLFASTM